MFLVELVMQGVRGFQQLTRLRFQGGFNLVVAGNEAGKTTTIDTMLRLLFPANDPAKTGSFLSRAPADSSRGALVVYSDDGAYYQTIQDFSKRAVNLNRHDPAAKKFVLMHKDWDSTAQVLHGLMPGISEEDFDRIFVLRRDACAGRAAAGSAPAALSRSAQRPSRTAADERKLAELRQTLHKAEEAADAEYKAEAARARLLEIGQRLERYAETRQRMAEMEEQIADLKACENLPDDLTELISSHENQESEKLAQTNQLESDIEGLTVQRDTLPAANLFSEKLFFAGAAVGALSLIAGLFLLSDEQAVFFPIGILAALLLIVAGWYNSSRKNAQRSHVQKEIDALVTERAAIDKKFQAAGGAIQKYLQATKSSSLGELKEKADNYRYFCTLHADMEQQQRSALGGQSLEEVQAEHAKQTEEVAALEQAAKALARYAVDAYSIRQEIERLEGAAEADQDPGFADFGAGGFAAPASAPGAGLNAHDTVAAAARVSGIEMDTLIPAVESAAQRALSAVSGGRYVKIEIGHEDQPQIVDGAGGRLPFSGLSHGTQLMACFCLRAAVVEAVAGKRRLPFLLDDPFAGMDPARQQAACQVLRVLGAKTQVILFTSNAALRSPQDAATELK